MAHASTHGARKPPGPICIACLILLCIVILFIGAGIIILKCLKGLRRVHDGKIVQSVRRLGKLYL